MQKKKNLVGAEIGEGGGPAAFFLKDTKTLGNYWLNQKDYFCYFLISMYAREKK